jgi:predicted dehydrogenase
MQLNVALLGAGAIAVDHLNAYRKDGRVKVTWICDPNLERAQKLAKEYDIPNITADYKVSLEDPHVNFVDIMAPNFLHKPMSFDAMHAGKAVLCEKPMALNAQESRDMASESQRTGVRLFVKYHQRFDPVHVLAKKMLETGEFPKPVMALATLFGNHLPSMLDPKHWRGIPSLTGGGCLFSSGSHIIDLLRFFFGDLEAITSVNRQLVADNPAKADDNASVILEFKSGIIATFVGCWTTNTWSRSYRWWNEDKTMYIYQDQNKANCLDVESGSIRKNLLTTPNWAKESHYIAISHFIDQLVNDVEPYYSLDECVKSMQALELAYKSSAEGRRILVR